MWSLGAVLSYIANDGEDLFRTEQDVFKWKGEKSSIKRQVKYPRLHTLVLSLLICSCSPFLDHWTLAMG